MCWLFHRIAHPGLRIAGIGLLVISFARLAFNPAVLAYHARAATPIFNWYLYTYGIVVVCLFFAAKMLAPPRNLILKLDAELVEMKRSRSKGLCCGAGGGQMFKEPEKGNKDINVERTEEALSTHPTHIAVACPFCMTMMTDGVKFFDKEAEVKVMDIAELIAQANEL